MKTPLSVDKIACSQVSGGPFVGDRLWSRLGIGRLAQAALNVSAVDLRRRLWNVARKNFQLYGLEGDLREANAEDLPFESNSFDIVASFGVLQQTESTPASDIRGVCGCSNPAAKR
jgi:hypothetical protein